MIIREAETPESARSSGGRYRFTLSADGSGLSCSYWARNHDAKVELARLLATAANELQDAIYERMSKAANELRATNHG